MTIIQGFIVMVLGALILVFRTRVKNFTGDISFAERYLGVGGTWTFLLILGIGLFIIGLMWSTGTIQSFLNEGGLSGFFG